MLGYKVNNAEKENSLKCVAQRRRVQNNKNHSNKFETSNEVFSLFFSFCLRRSYEGNEKDEILNCYGFNNGKKTITFGKVIGETRMYWWSAYCVCVHIYISHMQWKTDTNQCDHTRYMYISCVTFDSNSSYLRCHTVHWSATLRHSREPFLANELRSYAYKYTYVCVHSFVAASDFSLGLTSAVWLSLFRLVWYGDVCVRAYTY